MDRSEVSQKDWRPAHSKMQRGLRRFAKKNAAAKAKRTVSRGKVQETVVITVSRAP